MHNKANLVGERSSKPNCDIQFIDEEISVARAALLSNERKSGHFCIWQ